jgi:ABC-2 type transport system ATP-binding protein
MTTGDRGLSIRGVSKCFGAVRALDEVSFDVGAGEIFGFVGSNGAGKSTTMRIVLGVLAADAGQVRVDGDPVDLRSRRRIGYMPEERGLYPKMKVGDQLSYLAQLHGLPRNAASAAVARWTSRLAIDHYLGMSVDTLSLGNQQRAQLAAALVHDPSVLVLDEPFSGLDPVAVDVMSDVLREKASEGVPVLFSSHQLELVQRICDRVGIIRAGRMRAVGTVSDLRRGDYALLEVSAPDAPAGWADALPGVRGVRSEGELTVLELEPGADDQEILRAALRFGAVHHFAVRTPSLAELFREVIAA